LGSKVKYKTPEKDLSMLPGC